MTDPALRRGVFDGLIVGALMATVLFLSNVVFPSGPNESDDDPEYLVQIAIAYVLVAAALVLIGVRARHRDTSDWAGAKGGAAAGLTMALIVFLTAAVLDNAFFAIVSQQHDKRMAFERSGWTSMRAYLNYQNVIGALVVLPGATVVGGLLGALGGAIARPRRSRTAPATR